MASFYQDIPEPDELVVCPYDKVHVVAYKRLPYHLMKCRKNYTDRKMVRCPFNSRHEVPEVELRLHMSSCPDRHIVERATASKFSSSNWTKGNTDVPTYFPNVQYEDDDNWDAEPSYTPRIGVQARDFAGIGYYKNLTGLKPSQKKQYYANLRAGNIDANVALIESLNTDISSEQASVDQAATDHARTPEQTKKIEEEIIPTQQPTNFAQEYKAIGRGRGRGVMAGAATAPGVRSAQPAAEAIDEQARSKLIRKARKKLNQIESLIAKQAMGTALNEEEKIKVALKSSLLKQLKELEKSEA